MAFARPQALKVKTDEPVDTVPEGGVDAKIGKNDAIRLTKFDILAVGHGILATRLDHALAHEGEAITAVQPVKIGQDPRPQGRRRLRRVARPGPAVSGGEVVPMRLDDPPARLFRQGGRQA